MAKATSFLVAALGVGGAAGLLAIGALASPPPSTNVALPIAAELDGRLREVAAGVHARVATLADLPRLAAAVSTDAATVRDLTQDELMFRPRPDETIVIGQIVKGQKPLVLLQLPASGFTPTIAAPGVRLEIFEGKLYFAEVLRVQPRERADELSGALAIAWRVDTAALASHLDALGEGATLELGGRSLQLGGRAIPDGARTAMATLTGEAGLGAKLVVEAPVAASPATVPLRLGALALALAGLIGAALLRPRKTSELTAPIGSALGDLGEGAIGGQGEGAIKGASEASAGHSPAAAISPSVIGGETRAPDPATPLLAQSSSHSGLGSARTEIAASSASSGGASIGRYGLLRQLGAGGMAEVYLARATGEAGFEKLIALKVMLRELAQNPILVEHFLDEARLASSLTHPNIVQITDLGRAGDAYYIAMEFIDGADLAHLMEWAGQRKTQMPFRIALTVLRRICDGLHAAHSATGSDGKPLDIVHRDVKAANVFIARNGAVKVGDFGIAKATQARQVKKTEVGQVKGTPGYMAPEHRMGQTVDRRADIYGVGAIAYELLTGIEINLDFAMLAQLGREGWPHLAPPSQLRSELPPEIDAVVWKALAYDKADRYATCLEFEEALEAVANQHPPVTGDKAVAQWVEGELSARAVEPSSLLGLGPSVG